MVREPAARAGPDERLVQVPHHEVVVPDPVHVDDGARDVRDARAVREHVVDRDAVLARSDELGDVLADAVADVQQAALVEQVDHGRRDRLRGAEEAERGVGRREHRLGVPALLRPHAAGPADRAVEHDDALAADRQRDRGVDAVAEEPLGRGPDALDALGRHAALLRGALARRPDRQRLEVPRYGDAPERVGHERRPGQPDGGELRTQQHARSLRNRRVPRGRGGRRPGRAAGPRPPGDGRGAHRGARLRATGPSGAPSARRSGRARRRSRPSASRPRGSSRRAARGPSPARSPGRRSGRWPRAWSAW
ncbi:unannotated protein [freshwater metagenome]|uniref:Unannotated protein n=1 Tax=freshwater metagenome TaxID=449393 RepID=A0A6J7JUL2_9ZZZZ